LGHRGVLVSLAFKCVTRPGWSSGLPCCHCVRCCGLVYLVCLPCHPVYVVSLCVPRYRCYVPECSCNEWVFVPSSSHPWEALGFLRADCRFSLLGVRTSPLWHGVSYEFRRMHSRLCSQCEIGMEELPGRRMKCPNCGLEEDGDKMPVLWALKLY
jgi:hypothetical protein